VLFATWKISMRWRVEFVRYSSFRRAWWCAATPATSPRHGTALLTDSTVITRRPASRARAGRPRRATHRHVWSSWPGEFALPLGGKIADAIFNANLNELYLTNSTRHRIEIFQVANSTFVVLGDHVRRGRALGHRAVAARHAGQLRRLIVVADAGGTQLAIVDVRPGVRQLQWRQDLPNYLVETYKVLRLAGGTQEEIIVHDVSDRPQYVATVCRPAGGTACAPDGIYALYSTTPTQSSTSPFAGKATLRMERLVNTTNPALLFGKFFWEIAGTLSSTTTEYPPHRGDPGNDQHRGAVGVRRRERAAQRVRVG